MESLLMKHPLLRNIQTQLDIILFFHYQNFVNRNLINAFEREKQYKRVSGYFEINILFFFRLYCLIPITRFFIVLKMNEKKNI